MAVQCVAARAAIPDLRLPQAHSASQLRNEIARVRVRVSETSRRSSEESPASTTSACPFDEVRAALKNNSWQPVWFSTQATNSRAGQPHAAAAAAHKHPTPPGTMVGKTASLGPISPLRSTLTNNYRSPPVTPSRSPRRLDGEVATPPGLPSLRRGPLTDWVDDRSTETLPPSPPRIKLPSLQRPKRNAVACAVVALACALALQGSPATPEPLAVVDLSQTDYSAEPDLSQPPAPVPAPVYHLTHALLDARAEALKALPLQTKPPTPERHVVGKGASTVSWRLDPWLVNAALGTLITADVYVESRLFAQRQLEVQSADQRVAVDFGSLPDGVHGLSVVLKSASTLPRFAPQTLRATLTATGC